MHPPAILLPLVSTLAALGLFLPRATAAVGEPYTADAHTLGLYHFEEAPGTADPGNPIANFGLGSTALDFTNTGGPDGRDNTGGGGYQAASFPGFGTSFNVLASGTGGYHTAASTANGGGLETGAVVLQSSLQGASGAFTYEALINLSDSSNEHEILSHDGFTTRGFLFRVVGNTLSFFTGSTTLQLALPSTGPNVFVANQWFHAAVTYSGVETDTNNLKFYFTSLTSGAEEANLLGSQTLTADLTGTASNLLGAGVTTRQPFRFEAGLIDEVRLSDIARAPTDFVFLVPEPGSALLLGLSALALGLRRPRKP